METRKPGDFFNRGDGGSRDLYESYWTMLDPVLRERTTLPPRDPRFEKHYYAIFPMGPKGIHVAAVIDPPNCPGVPLRIELSLVKKELDDFAFWSTIVRNGQDEINEKLGPGLDWLTTTDNQLQVGKNFTGWDLQNQSHWPGQHNVLALELQRFKDTFEPLLLAAQT